MRLECSIFNLLRVLFIIQVKRSKTVIYSTWKYKNKMLDFFLFYSMVFI